MPPAAVALHDGLASLALDNRCHAAIAVREDSGGRG